MAKNSFEVHGRAEFRSEGDVLFLDLYGPWNMECIRDAAGTAWPQMDQMMARGPIGIVVIAHDSLLGTSDAVKAIGEETSRRGKLDRVAIAWVADQGLEGRELMLPILKETYAGIATMQAFPEVAPALLWVRQMIDAWKQSGE
jgi:hypothetical protein